MAKSKNKSNKSKPKPKIENLKPLEIEETIEKLPPRASTNLDTFLGNFPGKIVPMQVGGKKVISIELDLDDEEWNENWDADYEEEFEEYMRQLLGTQNTLINKTNLKKYLSYLKKSLNLPCLATGLDDMILDEEDYQDFNQSKKKRNVFLTMPVEDEIYKIIGFNNYFDEEFGILVEVEPSPEKRTKDKPILTVPLAQLEAYDPTSEDYELLETYSIWFCG
jgi:hypothetical protein